MFYREFDSADWIETSHQWQEEMRSDPEFKITGIMTNCDGKFRIDYEATRQPSAVLEPPVTRQLSDFPLIADMKAA